MPSQPASTYFTSSGQGRYLLSAKSVVQHVHDRQHGVEPDEVAEFQRSHGMVGSQPHRGVDGVHGADTLIEGVDGLVDHGRQDAVDDEGWEVLGVGGGLAEAERAKATAAS